MKNILRTSMFAFLLVALGACENDTDPVAYPNGSPVLLTPTDGTDFILTEENQDDVLATLVWDHSNAGVQSVANYTVEIAESGTNFADPIVGGVTTDKYVTWTVGQLNTVLMNENVEGEAPRFEPFTAYALDIRIKSALGNSENAMMQYSNVVTVNVTTFEAAVPVTPVLFFVGAPQAYYGLGAWDNATAIPMRYIGDGTTKVFEIYVKVGASEGFKFIGEQGTWDNGNYGTIGGAQDGNLENAGGSQDIKVAETDGDGFYYIQVDIDQMKYKSTKMNWGIIGSATGGWDNEIPMVYDFANNQFNISTPLSDGELKFRAANASQAIYGAGESWKFNVGTADPLTVYNQASGNFAITGGNYNLGLVVNTDGTAVVSGL